MNSSIDQFAKAFMPSKQNVIILNTGRSPQLTQVLNKLDEFDAKYPGAALSLFGYTEWLMYAKYNLERFYKYDTYIPSTFYYQSLSRIPSLKALNERCSMNDIPSICMLLTFAPKIGRASCRERV